MHETSAPTPVIHFGVFEVDLRSGELRKQGLKIKLHGQPMEVLVMLLEHAGEVVTREEMCARLWPDGIVVDFEHSINTAIKKIREALGDDADHPRYIETLPRKGYRFIYPVAAMSPSPAAAPVQTLTPGPSPGGRGEEEQEKVGPYSPVRGEPESVSVSLPSPGGERTAPIRSGTGEGGVAPVSPPATGLATTDRHYSQPPHPSSGGYTRRVVRALVDAALEAHHARTRWQRLALAGIAAAMLAVGLAVLVALNVAGLRDRITRVLAPVSPPATGAAMRTSPLQKIESIAVLPLENLSHDPEQEYFADGMTEALITNLGKIRALRVISRTTAMHFKGTKQTLPEIARELNVDAVVEGSVLRSGDRVRVTANLLHAPTDRHLWGDTFESSERDVLILQSEAARAITEGVRINLTAEDQLRLAVTRRVDPEAYELFLKARYLPSTEEGYSKAIEYLEEAVQKDPEYAPAYTNMAACYDYLALKEVLPVGETQQKARALVLKALELDNGLAEAHTALGEEKLLADWDWAGGLAELRRGIDLNPNSADCLLHYGWGLSLVGRFDEAITVSERAVQLDPLSFANVILARTLFGAHEDERATRQYQRMLHLEVESALAYYGLGNVYEAMGRNDEAVSGYLQAATLRGDSAEELQAYRDAYTAGGIRGYWKKNLEYLEEQAKRERVPAVDRAIFHAHAGEKEQAFKWLEKAFQQHAPALVFLKADRQCDPLRSDPRFQDLLRRMNFPP